MKIATALALSIGLNASVHAETFDLTKMPDTQRDVKTILNRNGAHCPTPIRDTQVGEDARGKIYKIDCQSSDGKAEWSVRLFLGQRQLVEPW